MAEDGLSQGTDMVLSVGGDGTFLSVSKLVSDSGIPVAGVNMGRLGFLSENRPEEVAAALLEGDYTIEDRALLSAVITGADGQRGEEFFALNEITVHRSGAAVLGVDVCIDGKRLPTYWADGLIVSTSSGSTAYSLSVGGPIVLPDSKVLLVSPIAPHNLNIRPLVVPDSSGIRLQMQSRDGKFIFTADNLTRELPEGASIEVAVARFSLRRVRLNRADFINALTEKLFWGEDVRNIK
jgi:NAD+ kinase